MHHTYKAPRIPVTKFQPHHTHMQHSQGLNITYVCIMHICIIIKKHMYMHRAYMHPTPRIQLSARSSVPIFDMHHTCTHHRYMLHMYHGNMLHGYMHHGHICVGNNTDYFVVVFKLHMHHGNMLHGDMHHGHICVGNNTDYFVVVFKLLTFIFR